MTQYFPEPNDDLRALAADTAEKWKDSEKGLYLKYRIERTDGSSAPGGKHEHCRYFVLDVDHDKHAIAALIAYIDSCRHDFPALARDLQALIDSLST